MHGLFHGVESEMCPGCEGVLVPQHRMVPLVSAAAKAVADTVDPEVEIAPMLDAGGGLACPVCAAEMVNFGYLGMHLVHLDRCGPCAMLWLDPDELTTLAVLRLQTDARVGVRARQRRAQIEGMSRRFDKIMKARIRERMMVHAFV